MALALTALVGASSASASKFVALGFEGISTWSGERSGENHKPRMGVDWFSCSKSSFSGTMAGESSTELTVSPQLSGCLGGPQPGGAVVMMNDCKYRFKAGGGAENQSTGTVGIVGCTKPMTFGFQSCLISVGNQEGIGTVKYTSTETEGFGTVQVALNLSSITYTRNNEGGCSGKSGTFSDGTYTGEWSVKGSFFGGPLNVQINGSPLPSPTLFASEEAPVSIFGSSAVESGRLILWKNLNCKYALSGTSSTVTAKTISLVPTYTGCSMEGQSIPDHYVEVNGCHYVFHVNGEFDIAGAGCAEDPITITRPGCIIIVGPQSGLSGVQYANAGSGKLRTISMSKTVSSLKYTTIGPNCPSEGTFSTGGVVTGLSPVSATNSSGVQQGLSVE